MRIIILLAIIAILLIPTTVQADEVLQTMPGGKVNTHVESKPEQTCHNWQENGWIVESAYYPIYDDYLEDFGHYFTQYPNTCKVQPEAQ
jgi:hypothetical protein